MPPKSKLSIKYFNIIFPNDEACLEFIFRKNHGMRDYRRVLGRACFQNPKGEQVYPLAGTIFERSSTPLVKWFYAIYLFSVSKHGVSAAEIQRHVEVTYKTAWRMARLIRTLMSSKVRLSGIVEVDETYIGGRRSSRRRWSNKEMVMGIVERGGKVHAKHLPARENHLLLEEIASTVEEGSVIFSDQLPAYRRTTRMGYVHDTVNHGIREYARGITHTNTIEGVWSQLKRSIRGTHVAVSKQHLQGYVDQLTFRYRQSSEASFMELLARI